MYQLTNRETQRELLNPQYNQVISNIDREDKTDWLISKLLPDLSTITTEVPYDKNAIQQVLIQVLGKQGSGKSELMKNIAGLLQYLYGIENVSAVFSDNFNYLLNCGWKEDVPVQLLVGEDLTGELFNNDFGRDLINRYFKIRHQMLEKTGLNNGLCIVAFTTHSFFGLPKDLRVNSDLLIVKSSPSNKYDYDYLVDDTWGIGRSNMFYIEQLEEYRKYFKEAYNYSSFNYHKTTGIIKIESFKANIMNL